MDVDDVSERNAAFWNDICGSNAAHMLGITDHNIHSLERFDQWFFDFYPYLGPFLDSSLPENCSVLEVGLGFGSVGQYLALSGRSYHGLDIATNAVDLMNFRLVSLGFPTQGTVGNVLDCPFPDNSFDAAVAIGSLHHTGNFAGAVKELVRVVKPGGVIVGMVYSLFSVRNWILSPFKTSQNALRNVFRPASVDADERLRWLSDHNGDGVAAPSTVYFSRRALKQELRQYGHVTLRTHNLDELPVGKFSRKIRIFMMRTPLSRIGGLDIYFDLKISDSSR